MVHEPFCRVKTTVVSLRMCPSCTENISHLFDPALQSEWDVLGKMVQIVPQNDAYCSRICTKLRDKMIVITSRANAF